MSWQAAVVATKPGVPARGRGRRRWKRFCLIVFLALLPWRSVSSSNALATCNCTTTTHIGSVRAEHMGVAKIGAENQGSDKTNHSVLRELFQVCTSNALTIVVVGVTVVVVVAVADAAVVVVVVAVVAAVAVAVAVAAAAFCCCRSYTTCSSQYTTHTRMHWFAPQLTA